MAACQRWVRGHADPQAALKRQTPRMSSSMLLLLTELSSKVFQGIDPGCSNAG